MYYLCTQKDENTILISELTKVNIKRYRNFHSVQKVIRWNLRDIHSINI